MEYRYEPIWRRWHLQIFTNYSKATSWLTSAAMVALQEKVFSLNTHTLLCSWTGRIWSWFNKWKYCVTYTSRKTRPCHLLHGSHVIFPGVGLDLFKLTICNVPHKKHVKMFACLTLSRLRIFWESGDMCVCIYMCSCLYSFEYYTIFLINFLF